MAWIPKLRLNKKPQNLDIKQVNQVVEKSLAPYIKRDELEKYLKDIEKDERRKRIWDSLSPQKKIKLLRYVFKKKEEANNAKKRR